MTMLAAQLSAFLREHLPRERKASPHTCEAYAYAVQLLVCFAASRLRVRPSQLAVEQLDVPLVLAFLEHVEAARGCSARTRNARLAAIHSFFRFLEYRVPSCLEQAQQVGAIPMKKTDQVLIRHLNRDEIRALLDAPDARSASACAIARCCIWHSPQGCGSPSWSGSDWTSLSGDQLPVSTSIGKGRRERILPLWKETASAIATWLKARAPDGDPELFLNVAKRSMTRSGFEYILAKPSFLLWRYFNHLICNEELPYRTQKCSHSLGTIRQRHCVNHPQLTAAMNLIPSLVAEYLGPFWVYPVAEPPFCNKASRIRELRYLTIGSSG